MNSLIKNKKTLAMLLTLSIATSQLNAFSFSALFGSLSVSAKQAAKSIITSASKTSITNKTFTLASICLVATLYSIFCTRNKIHDIAVGTFLNQEKLHKKLLFAINNRLELVDSLLFRCTKKTINTPDKFGRTPLFHAYESGKIDIAEKLQANGATGDINTTDKFGRTPLFLAIANGDLDTAKKLQANGATGDINTPNKLGRTPLFHAYANGDLDIAEKLKKAGAIGDINTPDKLGRTPLFHAYANGDLDIAEKLKKADAIGDINTPDKFGRTPLFCVYGSGDLDMAEKLKKAGAIGDINTQDKLGHTPLFFAIANGDIEAEAKLKNLMAKEIDNQVKKIEIWKKIRPIINNYNKNAYEILDIKKSIEISDDIIEKAFKKQKQLKPVIICGKQDLDLARYVLIDKDARKEYDRVLEIIGK